MHGNYDPTWHAEPVPCAKEECKDSYTFLYLDTDMRIDLGDENVVDKMRRTAVKIVDDEHPTHFTRTHKWDGKKWSEADSDEARKSL